MNRLTKRVDGLAVLESWAIDKDPVSVAQRLCSALAAYEDTGLEPEDLKKAFNETAILKLAAQAPSTTPDHLRDLIHAEQHGRLVVLDEKTALSMYAGARAIENNKRLFGATYVYDIFGKQGGPKEIPYFDAANNLRNIASAMSLKGGEG